MAANWFEDESFWRDFYPLMFPAERFAAAAAEVDQILLLAKPPGHKLLDLCCGPGRHAVEFARRGFSVTGVDRTEFLLAKAREHPEPVEWVQQDMREFSRPGFFDMACCLFTSFGYFADDEANRGVLKNVHASLGPAGVFVIDVLGKERLARIRLDAICTDHPDGIQWVQRPRIYDDWTKVRNQWTLIKDGQARTFWLEHFIYSGRELKDMLLQSGFSSVELFGNFRGSPYDVDADRLVAVGRR
jgi:SAM-dependent methyltransferase